MKSVSILIPAYNAEKCIEKCLDSAINQTYKNIEIIVVNDGSIDNSLKIMNDYACKYNRIRIIDIENGGVSVARNTAIREATGDYICFIDSDDYISDDLLEKLSRYMEEDFDLIKYKLMRVDENGAVIVKLDGPTFECLSGEDAFNLMYDKDVMLQAPCLYLYKKELFIKNNITYPEGRVHEDFSRTIPIMLKAKKMCSTDIYGYYYVQTKKSITRGNNLNVELKKSLDIIYHYDYVIKEIEGYDLDSETKEHVRAYYANNAILEAENLEGLNRKRYISELKKRNVSKNIKARNIKQLIKKIILKININLYLKLR